MVPSPVSAKLAPAFLCGCEATDVPNRASFDVLRECWRPEGTMCRLYVRLASEMCRSLACWARGLEYCCDRCRCGGRPAVNTRRSRPHAGAGRLVPLNFSH